MQRKKFDKRFQACYIPRFAGEVAEWLMAADCKSALLRVRWFESSPLHQRRICFVERELLMVFAPGLPGDTA